MKKSPLTCYALLISVAATAQATTPCQATVKDIAAAFIAFTPLLMFVIILFIVFRKLSKEGYKIGDALKENTTLNVSVENPANTQEQPAPPPALRGEGDVPPLPNPTPVTEPPYVGKTIQPKSTSRLLAFLSGLISLGLASAMLSFWMYRYFQCGVAPKIEDISEILISLGIGVIPYAVNKLSPASAAAK